MQATSTLQTERITINDVKNICRIIEEFDTLTVFEVKSIFRHINNYFLCTSCHSAKQAVEELKDCVERRLNRD